MPQWTVLIGSRSFGKASTEHVRRLEAAGCIVIPNDIGRAYTAGELLGRLPGVDAIITGTDDLNAAVIEGADRLKTIAKHGVGLETIDLEAARRRGIVVSATPGAIHEAVADLTMALMLAVARKIVPADRAVRSGRWPNLVGFELAGKTLGIVGLGRIGKGACVRAQGFGMRVIATDVHQDARFAAHHDLRYLPLQELLAEADIVTLHAAVDASAVLIGKRELAIMKPGAVIINTARGHLIDEPALIQALQTGRLAGAGLDVLADEPPGASPLFRLDQVVLTPHIGGQTQEGLLRMGDITVENCLRALRGEAPLYAV
jgi:D-3-phosphoglycerate dehydrogenase